MIQSPLLESKSPALHAAIIMDGSGRWACSRGLARKFGHRAGVEAVRRVIAAAPTLGIDALTLHAFSRDNWNRPDEEVGSLISIFEEFFAEEPSRWVDGGVRAQVFGRRNRLSNRLRDAIAYAESSTADGRALDVRFAIDYSSREAIRGAFENHPILSGDSDQSFHQTLAQSSGAAEPIPPADLLIRTGGEQRLSDFFLWECAYAELYFTPVLWPDFSAEDLEAAVREFQSRDRRYGRIVEPVTA